MIIVRPGAHLSTTAAGQASPTTASAVDSRPSGESIATADGVWVRTVTCSATSRSWKSAGEAVIDSGTTGINCVTLWCVTATPLGAPVVPEV
ncbi:Uncharacterised protein [Mycobacteroides abscessus subsp. abscessus]|nr:Uncharacterised protein [Mycobacteroides abscessus subsp. abscessus]